MWHTQSAVVTGRGHLLLRLPGQDRTFTLEENGVTVAALADGAGSAPLSHEGAEQAVRAACRSFAGNLNGSVVRPPHLRCARRCSMQ